jgi:hypothetical protein
MNILPCQKQIEVIAALCEGVGVRATARLTGVNRETVGKLALDIGRACAELHDRLMVGVRVARVELDECWSFVGKKQKRVGRHEAFAKGDQYVFIGMAGTQKAIISYRVGKRDSENTDTFIRDLRERVIGVPELSSDGFKPYMPAIRDAFAGTASHGMIVKTLSVTDLRKDAAHRYSPAAVVAVAREVVSGMPEQISTSFVEREHLVKFTIGVSAYDGERLAKMFGLEPKDVVDSYGLPCKQIEAEPYLIAFKWRVPEKLDPDRSSGPSTWGQMPPKLG